MFECESIDESMICFQFEALYHYEICKYTPTFRNSFNWKHDPLYPNEKLENSFFNDTKNMSTNVTQYYKNLKKLYQ